VKINLGVVRERVDSDLARHLDRALQLVDEGMRGIRNVTNDLRPSLLDDLGLLPALRSLVADFAERRGVNATLDAPDSLPMLSDEAEVALFRALQEALSNVARHAGNAPAHVEIREAGADLILRVSDRGPGFGGEGSLAQLEAEGHLGLAGMRERITALGGEVAVKSSPGAGVVIVIRIPVSEGGAA
jgi:signal transduction histidine kinase